MAFCVTGASMSVAISAFASCIIGGMEVEEARRLRALEDENSRFKRVVADQAVQIQILKEVNAKKW
jgi:hypothetical protein